MDVLASGGLPRPLSQRLLGLGAEFWRYFLVSLLALGVDFGGLVLLKEGFHLYYLAASAISYMSGAVVQYGLSVAFVFREHRMANRTAEFIAFTLLGLLGLAATQAVLWLLVGHAHVGYIFAKVIAVGASFVLNYTARRLVLFTHGQAK